MTALSVGVLIAVVVFAAGAVRVSWDYIRKQCPWCHESWDSLGNRSEHLKTCTKANRQSR
jgi:hypothetical protein